MTTVLEQPTFRGARTTNSTIETTYVDFPVQAKSAFEEAVSIWESYIVSPQKIKIEAKWTSLSGTTLAQSGATKIFRNFPSAPLKDVWYPVALAEAISGQNLNTDEFEITVSVNRNLNWSFELDGTPQSNRFDMVSVVLHEIAHGFGFNASFKLTEDGFSGEWGQTLVPYVFDTFVQNGNEEFIKDTRIFGNPSAELKRQLTGNDLFFALGKSIFSERLPQLSAVDPFRSGGSVSHLDEFTYPQGNINSLMSPNLRTAEVIHSPGNLTLLILNQIGWGIRNLPISTNTITSKEPDFDVLVYPNPTTDELYIQFPSGNAANMTINISDMWGRLFYQKSELPSAANQLKIDTSSWIPQTYILKIDLGSFSQTHKIIIHK